MLDAKAFIALETTQSSVMRSTWRKTAERHITALAPMLADGLWDYAHEYVDRITMQDVVGGSVPRLEELAVSSILFGAQNVTQDLKKTSFVTGAAGIPIGLQQAIAHMQVMVERDGAELLRNELHALIRAEEVQLREPLEKAEETLYVMRPLKNAVQLIAWAKAQGFPSTLEDDDFHVTVCYSKAKVEWGNVAPRGDTFTVAGGARQIELFGKALVLTFDSPDLQERHKELRAAGASSDFPAYRPHVTISYASEDFDFSRVEPFTGDLVFGPEEFAPVKEDWSSNIKETRLAKAEQSLAEKLNNAVLGKGGKIIDIGANLTTSRLVSLGFLAQAVDASIDTYQVNEVLDDRTCPVCRYMHGKTFRTENEYARLLNVLGTSDPKELKGLAPWPLQTKAGLKQLYAMSAGDMQASGYGSPPYHPGCRGMLALKGSVEEEIPIGAIHLIEPAITAAKPEAVAKDFARLSEKFDQSGFSEDNVKIIDEYTGNAHNQINRDLRRGIPTEGEKEYLAYRKNQIKRMDDAMKKWELPATVTLYRGVDKYEQVFGVNSLDELVGKKIKDKGFMSVSGSLAVASDFGSFKGAVLEIKVPAGTKAVIPQAMDGVLVTAEDEVILARGLTLKVTGVDKLAKPPRIFAEITTKVSKDDDSDQTADRYAASHSRFVWSEGDVTVK